MNDFATAFEKIQSLRSAMRAVVKGQDEVIDQVIVSLLGGGHVLLEGVPGLGKTLIVKTLAKCFGGDFSRIQFTPDLMPSDVTGHSLFNMSSQEFEIRKGPIFTNLLLADEINRSPAKTQAALLEVMQEQQVTIEGHSYATDTPFMVLATQNPIEQEGTYPLPEAELDRFLMKVFIDYPNEADEQLLVDLNTRNQGGLIAEVKSSEAVLQKEELTAIQQLVNQITTDQEIINYAVRIVRATRDWPGINKGAGPRGSINLILAARARALLAGNEFVTPDDVKSMALPVLRHRLILSPDLEIEGVSEDVVLSQLLSQIQAPRQ